MPSLLCRQKTVTAWRHGVTWRHSTTSWRHERSMVRRHDVLTSFDDFWARILTKRAHRGRARQRSGVFILFGFGGYLGPLALALHLEYINQPSSLCFILCWYASMGLVRRKCIFLKFFIFWNLQIFTLKVSCEIGPVSTHKCKTLGDTLPTDRWGDSWHLTTKTLAEPITFEYFRSVDPMVQPTESKQTDTKTAGVSRNLKIDSDFPRVDF